MVYSSIFCLRLWHSYCLHIWLQNENQNPFGCARPEAHAWQANDTFVKRQRQPLLEPSPAKQLAFWPESSSTWPLGWCPCPVHNLGIHIGQPWPLNTLRISFQLTKPGQSSELKKGSVFVCGSSGRRQGVVKGNSEKKNANDKMLIIILKETVIPLLTCPLYPFLNLCSLIKLWIFQVKSAIS